MIGDRKIINRSIDTTRFRSNQEVPESLSKVKHSFCNRANPFFRRSKNPIKTKMSATQEEDKKPEDDGVHIILKVKSQDGDEVLFKIKRSTQLKKLMYAYCDRRGLKIDAFCFFFDMRRLRREQTPDELDMEDGDLIDALLPMSGGLRANQRQWSYMLFDKIE